MSGVKCAVACALELALASDAALALPLSASGRLCTPPSAALGKAGSGEWSWTERASASVSVTAQRSALQRSVTAQRSVTMQRSAVREMDGKGGGACACRAFATGEVLFAERPLLRWFQHVDDSKQDNLRWLEAARAGLPSAARAEYDALMQEAMLRGTAKAILGAFLSIAHPTEDSDQKAMVSSAVFALASRIHRGCDANVSHTWIGHVLVVRATRAIQAGAEVISDCYIGDDLALVGR